MGRCHERIRCLLVARRAYAGAARKAALFRGRAAASHPIALIEGHPPGEGWSHRFSWNYRVSFAKMLAGQRISDIQAWFRAPSAITRAHGQPVFALVRSTGPPFS